MGEAEAIPQLEIKDIINCTAHNAIEEFDLHRKLVENDGQLIGGILEIVAGDDKFSDISIHGKITDKKQFRVTTKLSYIIPGSKNVHNIFIGNENIVKYHETYYDRHTRKTMIKNRLVHFRIYNEVK